MNNKLERLILRRIRVKVHAQVTTIGARRGGTWKQCQLSLSDFSFACRHYSKTLFSNLFKIK